MTQELTPNTQITQENVGLKMFGEVIAPDSFEARAIAAGHTLVMDEDGQIDAFVFEGRQCNGPGCSTCGWSACHHCNSPIPTCTRPALSPPAEGEDRCASHKAYSFFYDACCLHCEDPTPAPIDWNVVGPKLVEAAKTARLAISGRINEYTAPQSDLWSALLQIEAALAAAQPEDRT